MSFIRSTSPRYKLIDLFCGAGGLTQGFTEVSGACFTPVWANDLDAESAATYKANFGHKCIVGDIVKLLLNPSTRIPKADVVVGGPPCQGFSRLNKKRHGDPRKQLWKPFLEVVERSGADVFVMENVPEVLRSDEYLRIKEAAERCMHFHVRCAKLMAADYGVPQIRSRAFIIGCKFADPRFVFPPPKTHYNPEICATSNKEGYVDTPVAWRTVRDAIADLPPPEGTNIRIEAAPLDLHFGRSPTSTSLQRYLAVPDEGMNRFDLLRRARQLTPPCWIRKKSGGTDLFGRLWWDRPAFTIRTEFFKPEKGRYLHPTQHRPITHREAARFQSFPDGFKFCGSKIGIAKQIGNAVPPLLAERLADCVVELLRRRPEADQVSYGIHSRI